MSEKDLTQTEFKIEVQDLISLTANELLDFIAFLEKETKNDMYKYKNHAYIRFQWIAKEFHLKDDSDLGTMSTKHAGFLVWQINTILDIEQCFTVDVVRENLKKFIENRKKS